MARQEESIYYQLWIYALRRLLARGLPFIFIGLTFLVMRVIAPPSRLPLQPELTSALGIAFLALGLGAALLSYLQGSFAPSTYGAEAELSELRQRMARLYQSMKELREGRDQKADPQDQKERQRLVAVLVDRIESEAAEAVVARLKDRIEKQYHSE